MVFGRCALLCKDEIKECSFSMNVTMSIIKCYNFCIMAVLFIVSLLFFWKIMEFVSISAVVFGSGIPLNVNNKLCCVSLIDRRKPSHINNNIDLKVIYFITPTYPRPEQVPELTRLGNTLMHVPRLHWIIADDEPACSDEVLNILRRTGLPFTLLSSPKPYVYKTSNFPRGVSNRRAALDWIQENISEGILYFGNDDNTFDLRLFDEIRSTKKVSMFPVGLVGESWRYEVASPVVKDGKVVSFFAYWSGGRTFPVDMAGFAVNIEFLKHSATMPYIEGFEEDEFIISLGLKADDIEPLADNCSKIFVWHTKTAKFKKPVIRINLDKLEKFSRYKSFLNLLREITGAGMVSINPDNGIRPQIVRNKKCYDVVSGLE